MTANLDLAREATDNFLIRGFDTCDFSNLMRSWFKYDGLVEYCKSKEKGIAEKDISAVIYAIEDRVRSDLFEFAESFESSEERAKHYVHGLHIALSLCNISRND